MGRPREHDESTGAALLEAAERTIESEGLDGLSVRGLADEVGTTTRAVYSLFGSKEGLLVALGAKSFEVLGDILTAQHLSGDPARDLSIAGLAFREFALRHPALFRIGVQRLLPDPSMAAEFAAAAQAAFGLLMARVQPMHDAGLLHGRSVRSAATEYHALCEGLAAVELRGALMRSGTQEQIWRDALSALVAGFAASAPPRARRRSARSDRAD